MGLQSREWIVRFSSMPLIFLAVTVLAAVLGRSWFVFLLWGPFVLLSAVLSWRPFRLSRDDGQARLEYLQGLRWMCLSATEVNALRYEHTLLDLRGRALLRADLADGRTIRIPGTAGVYWFRQAASIPSTPIPLRGFHLVSTIQMLSLVQQRLGVDVDTYDAVAMNPRR